MTRAALLVPGGHGQLGTEIARRASTDGGAVLHRPTSAELDITDSSAVDDALRALVDAARARAQVPVVVNAAAYTAVDAAESDVDRAHAVNEDGPANLAAACRRHHVAMVHLSTDYVFDGTAQHPYATDDVPAPTTVYGRSKLAGERAVQASGTDAWVVRTAWVYATHGANFLTTMARLERERAEVSVVDDQIGSPTWAVDLAAGVLAVTDRIAARRGPEPRLLHCTNSGRASWFEFARAVFAGLGADPERVRPCSTAEFPRPAPRPAYSVLSGDTWLRAGLPRPRSWSDALEAALARGV